MCVVKERPGELFPEVFWLITSMSADAMPADALLALYRKRGKAEGHMGELESVADPALSSSPRPKRWYRGRPVGQHGPSVDTFACNEVRLLVALFGYQILHVRRMLLERATQTGWSLGRLLERVLCAPARFTVSGRLQPQHRSIRLPRPAPASSRACGRQEKRPCPATVVSRTSPPCP